MLNRSSFVVKSKAQIKKRENAQMVVYQKVEKLYKLFLDIYIKYYISKIYII